ncbi:hypothetical protein BGZ47_001671 [Haplosporangium gracile]|nr:hypothetical protein BGZ47_001671 [Haplosporangium gracile]
MDNIGPVNGGDSSNNASVSSTTATGVTGAASRKPPGFRNLQPRAAARMDFNDNDSDDDDSSGILSADYIAQRKTTQDLVDFFKSAPPPSPPQPTQPLNLLPIEDEKKKKPLLQWLRPKKSGSNLNAVSSNAGGSTLGGMTTGRNSMLVQGAGGAVSNISTVSGVTMGKGKNGEDITTSTLPNGRKYIMIAIDYKEGEDGHGAQQPRSAGSTNSDGLSISNGSFMTTTRLPNGGTVSSRRQSRVPDDATTLTIDGLSPGAAAAKRLSILSSTLGSDLNGNAGGEGRRSILQTNTTDSISDGSKYVLGGSSFLLENFALDTDFMGQATGVSTSGGGPASSELQRAASNKSGAAVGGGGDGGGSVGISRTGSKRGNKVKFSLLGDPNADGGVPLDEAVVAEALAQRLASYKTQQQGKSTTTITATTTSTSTTTTMDGGSSCTSQEQQDYPEIVLPKPVSRKKVRHVQIQTQHCVMRAMHTQTEPYENMVHDLDIKEWSSAPPSVSGSIEIGSTTAGSTITSSSAGADSALLREELAQLREQNTTLQTKVSSLERDLAAETRARNRTAVAMQDTRDKFEMLSAMAYKKLKEMIFQRHILEMEVRELRAQVDLHSEVSVVREGEILFRQEQQQQQLMHQQQQYLYQTA